MGYIIFFVSFFFLFPAKITFFTQRPLLLECGWRTKREGKNCLQCAGGTVFCCRFMLAFDLDLFDVRLEQQTPRWWQVGWNVLRSWDHKIRNVWSSTPGGQIQKPQPAACQTGFLPLNSKHFSQLSFVKSIKKALYFEFLFIFNLLVVVSLSK